MASSTSHAPERSKIEQIVVEFFAKSLHIILESRIPALCVEGDCLGSSPSSSSSGTKSRDRWFNLALGDCIAALQNFEPWRRNFSDPMIVDILLDQTKSLETDSPMPRASPSDQHWPKGCSPLKGISGGPNDDGIVLERWTVQFEQYRKDSLLSSSLGHKGGASNKTGSGPNNRRGSSIDTQEMKTDVRTGIEAGNFTSRGGANTVSAQVTEVPAVYKRTVIMLRSLYNKCRLLPAYRLFRLSNSPSNCCNFSLRYRVLSSAAPFSELDKREISVYNFTPVDTSFGRMRLSVTYRRTTAVVALEVVPSILPRIIPDYVGSPTTDPLKRFTGDPQSLPSGSVSINRGIHMISVPSSLQNSPPGMFLGRRHSWSGRVNQIQPALQPPSSPSHNISRSPSPSYPFQPYSLHPPSPYSPYSQKQPSSDCSMSPICSPISSGERLSGVHTAKRTSPISIDNRCSPPLSPSPSPSPPTIYIGSDPVSIPKVSSYTRGGKFPTGDIHQRYRNLLPPLSPSSRKAGLLLRSSSESPRYSGQLPSHQHAHQSRSFESSLHLQMLHDETGQQVSSRSSSKTHAGDDGEDEEFSCPFAVDDMDSDEKASKSDAFSEISESSSSQQGSQDAAVGVLIRILKSALPLRHSYQMESSLGFDCDRNTTDLAGVTSRLTSAPVDPFVNIQTAKTAAAALEEFQIYKNTRDLMCPHGTETGASMSQR